MKKKNLSIILIAVMLIILLFLLIFSSNGLLDTYRLSNDYEEISALVDKLKAENNSLKNEIKLLKSDKNKIEQVARERYGLIKPGEEIYLIRIK